MSKETKQCPFCGKEIKYGAKKCRHCGKWLNETEQALDNSCNSFNNSTKSTPKTNANQETSNPYSRLGLFVLALFAFVVFYGNSYSIEELTTGCSSDGEDIAGYWGTRETFFCKDKLWSSVDIEKPFSFNGGSHPIYKVYMERRLVGIYEWKKGEYYCSYAWNENLYGLTREKAVPCSEYDFVKELKEKLTKYKNGDL